MWADKLSITPLCRATTFLSRELLLSIAPRLTSNQVVVEGRRDYSQIPASNVKERSGKSVSFYARISNIKCRLVDDTVPLDDTRVDQSQSKSRHSPLGISLALLSSKGSGYVSDHAWEFIRSTELGFNFLLNN